MKIKKKTIILRSILLLLFPFALILVKLAKANSLWIETYYTQKINAATINIISRVTAFLPFSLAEIIILISPFCLIIYLFVKICALIRSNPNIKHVLTSVSGIIINLACLFSVMYFLFIALWGLNYYRPPLSTLVSFDTSDITVDELYETCIGLSENINHIRENLSEDAAGVFHSKKSLDIIMSGSGNGYNNLTRQYSFIHFTPKRTKPVIFSEALSYLGISGIYIPHTAEANINKDISPCMLPSTLAHEQAHQLGFAREDEANFISFMACIANPDEEFQYSGYMLAFIHASNALYSADQTAYTTVMNSLSDATYRDLRHNWDFWKRYEGKASEVSNKVNDNYLKAQGQTQGVRSYGRMVDLVIGYFRNAGVF